MGFLDKSSDLVDPAMPLLILRDIPHYGEVVDQRRGNDIQPRDCRGYMICRLEPPLMTTTVSTE